MPISCLAVSPGTVDMKTVKRIVADQCCGAVVDMQGFFLAQIDTKLRARLKTIPVTSSAC